MSKSKHKRREASGRLRYNGDGRQFITAPVPIPARDLDEIDLMELANAYAAVGGEWTAQDVAALLSDGKPGRKMPDGRPLYEPESDWQCGDCEERFASWDEYNAHALAKHAEQESRDDEDPKIWLTD